MKWNVPLAISIALSALAFAALAYLVWMNRGGERVPMLFWKVVCGPLAVTIFLLGYELTKPLAETNTTVPLTFWRVGQNLLANRDLPVNDGLPVLPGGYLWFETCYGGWSKKNPDGISRTEPEHFSREYDFYAKLAEAGFVNWMASRYPLHWQIDDRPLEGFLGPIGRIGSRSKDAEPKPSTFSTEEIARIIDNDLLLDENLGAAWKVGLPANSKIREAPSDRGGRGVSIETPFINLNVTFWCFQFPVEIKRDSKHPIIRQIATAFNSTDVSATYVYVDFHIAPKRMRRWSGRTEQELKWSSTMAELFKKDFQWSAVSK